MEARKCYVDQEVGLLQVLRIATWSRRNGEDGRGRFVRRKGYDGASRQREVKQIGGLNDVLWIQIGILGRYAAASFLTWYTRRRRRRVAAKGDPSVITRSMRARTDALWKEMGIFQFLILIPPDTTFAIAVNVGKTDGTGSLRLDFHDTFDVIIHAAAVGELHESKLVNERGWTHNVFGFLALDDGSRSSGSFGLHFFRGVKTNEFGLALGSKDGE